MTPFPPTRQEALNRARAVRAQDYARSRNHLDGAVTRLSPYITHGLISLPEGLACVTSAHALDIQHKFVFELGWREYFRHVWHARGDGILNSLHAGPLPDASYAQTLPADIRHGATGVPVVDQAVRTLYASGYLHNHARMWLASYVVHMRKVHWRVGADWMYGHLLDGDLASNHLSWQWVAGTGSHKPYLFNADNVAKYAPASWRSPGTVIDQSYEALDQWAQQPEMREDAPMTPTHLYPTEPEPPLLSTPPQSLGMKAPNAADVAGRHVWLVHPWNLGDLPTTLSQDTVVVGVFVNDFHQAFPWSEGRWHFVASRMAALASVIWHGDAATIEAALKSAHSVQSTDDLHVRPWLSRWAQCEPAPTLFPAVDRRCDSFSQWWTRATRGIKSASELLVDNRATQRLFF